MQYTPTGNTSSTATLFPRSGHLRKKLVRWHNLPWDDPRAIAARTRIGRSSWQTRYTNYQMGLLRDMLVERLWAQIVAIPVKRRRRRKMTLEQALAVPTELPLGRRQANRRAVIARIARSLAPLEDDPEPDTLCEDIAQTDLHSIPDELQRDPVDAVRRSGREARLAPDNGDIVHEEIERRRG